MYIPWNGSYPQQPAVKATITPTRDPEDLVINNEMAKRLYLNPEALILHTKNDPGISLKSVAS